MFSLSKVTKIKFYESHLIFSFTVSGLTFVKSGLHLDNVIPFEILIVFVIAQ